jgi:glycosyltransferase involved in cell wall biosynthesis
MRIAQVAPLAEAVPPKLYGGTERVVSWLTEELLVLGHDVTLFASGDSTTGATLVPVIPRALRLENPRPEPFPAYAGLLDALAKSGSDFDVVHCHIDWLHLPARSDDWPLDVVPTWLRSIRLTFGFLAPGLPATGSAAANKEVRKQLQKASRSFSCHRTEF